VFEAEATRRAVASIVDNDRERTALQTIAPDASIVVVPAGVDAQHWQWGVLDATEAFAVAIVNCLALEHDERRAISESVDLAALSWEHRLAPLSRLLEGTARRERS
jgi:hypothetical protein